MSDKGFVTAMRKAFETDNATFVLIYSGTNYDTVANTLTLFDTYAEIVQNAAPNTTIVAPYTYVAGFYYGA